MDISQLGPHAQLVLDKGYVRIPTENDRPLVMGSDLSGVNAARASFMKESKEFGPNDKRLLEFCLREGHFSVFRHSFVTIEVKAPLMVARQWWKYVVGSDHTMDGWNEASRRYITMEPEFYLPEQWRLAPENRKQGSGGNLGAVENVLAQGTMESSVEDGLARYNYLVNSLNIAPEMARGVLPAYFMYTVWRWSCSLQSLMHFLMQRVADDAQLEIQCYAQAVRDLTEPFFPVTIGVVKDILDARSN